MKYQLYRLQQRLALPRQEATFVLFASFVLFIGFIGVHLQQQPPALPDDVYAEADRLFAEGTASLDAGPALPKATTAATAATPIAPAPIDLNTATRADLEQLPRIGPKLAERILTYRTQRGGFRRVDDLLDVRGIGAKTLDRLTPHLTVGASD
jgi:competence ComEA-like helix-hairpin-helix protein